METNEGNKPSPGTEIAAEEAHEVGGGTATATVSTSCGASVSSSGATTGSALIDMYDGAVELTTHVMERVAGKS